MFSYLPSAGSGGAIFSGQDPQRLLHHHHHFRLHPYDHSKKKMSSSYTGVDTKFLGNHQMYHHLSALPTFHQLMAPLPEEMAIFGHLAIGSRATNKGKRGIPEIIIITHS